MREIYAAIILIALSISVPLFNEKKVAYGAMARTRDTQDHGPVAAIDSIFTIG